MTARLLWSTETSLILFVTVHLSMFIYLFISLSVYLSLNPKQTYRSKTGESTPPTHIYPPFQPPPTHTRSASGLSTWNRREGERVSERCRERNRAEREDGGGASRLHSTHVRQKRSKAKPWRNYVEIEDDMSGAN